MKPLFEITKEAKAIYDYLDSLDMDEDVILDTIDAETDINQKLVNYGHVIRLKQAELTGLKAEYERLGKLIKHSSNHIYRLEQAVFDAMMLLNIPEIKDDLFTFKIRTNPESVNVLNADLVPEDFLRIKKELDKTSIKKAIQAGQEVAGCELIRTKSLSMK